MKVCVIHGIGLIELGLTRALRDRRYDIVAQARADVLVTDELRDHPNQVIIAPDLSDVRFVELFHAGVRAFLDVHDDDEALYRAVKAAWHNDLFVTETLVDRVLAATSVGLRQVEHGLSGRQLRAVAVLASRPDLTYREIGERLGLSPDTIKTHVRAAAKIFGVRGRDGVAQRARELGIGQDAR